MKRILSAIGLGVFSLGLGACSHGMPSQPYNRDISTSRVTTPQAQALTNAFDTSDDHTLANVFTAAGDIAPTVGAYQRALGNLNANTPGSQTGGRREINWDAVPALFTNTDNFPVDFFNQPAVGRARGAVFSTPGTGFRVSDNNFSDLDLRFGEQFIDILPLDPREPADGGRGRMDHFCLSIRCDDLKALADDLRGKGAKLEGDVVQRYGAYGDGPSLYLRDPDDYVVELKPR